MINGALLLYASRRVPAAVRLVAYTYSGLETLSSADALGGVQQLCHRRSYPVMCVVIFRVSVA